MGRRQVEERNSLRIGVSRDTGDPVQTGLRSHALHCLLALVALRVVSPVVVRPRSTVIGHVVRDLRIRYTIML